MKDVRFKLTGFTSLLMHADDVMGADELDAWRKDKKNKNKSKPGDDRSPPWTWLYYCYKDDEWNVSMPKGNIMPSLRYGGTQLSLKGQKTYKSLTQSGLLIIAEDDENCEFRVHGEKVNLAEMIEKRSAPFPDHIAFAKKNGFKLDVRRAKVGTSKHIRVRPRFANWEVTGVVRIIDPDIEMDALVEIFEVAGKGGLGDWRTTAPKSPGSFGMYTVELDG